EVRPNQRVADVPRLRPISVARLLFTGAADPSSKEQLSKLGATFNKANSSPRITARRGGRAIKKILRSIRFLRGRGGVPIERTRNTTPAASIRRLRAIFLVTPPPLLAVMRGGEFAFFKMTRCSSFRFIRSISLALVLVSAACAPKSTNPQPDKLTIAVIPKGTSHLFWQSVHAGAQKAATELGVDIVWRGPLREDDRDSQVSEVDGFVSRGVSGIVLAPLDESALVTSVSNATRSKIPVVIFDSGLKGTEYVSFVATDNLKGGRLAGDHLAKLLNGKGKVAMLRYAEGSNSTSLREQGFLDAMKENPGIEVVSSNQYAGADVEGAYKKSEGLLSRFKSSDGTQGIDGVFCPNESTTVGMLRALEDNGRAGKVRFVGFDSSGILVKGL